MGDSLIDETVIVFANKVTNVPFSFNLTLDKQPVDDKEDSMGHKSIPPIDDIYKVEEIMVDTFFNVDASVFMERVPEIEATYYVYATNNLMKSNVIEIKIAP